MIRHLCGFEREGLAVLFERLRPAMSAAWPHSPHMSDDLKANSKHSTLEFRLFVVLFWLRTGTPRRTCEFIFGWSHQTISGWIDTIIDIMCRELKEFREFPSFDTQRDMALEHQTFVGMKFDPSVMHTYHLRINFERKDGDPLKSFNGAFGAIDGTYTVCCRFPNDIQEQMYTGYKKFHAYKLVVICSLFTKAIIAVSIAPGRVSDVLTFDTDRGLWNKIAPGHVLLGDDAFTGRDDVVSPFTTAQINCISGVDVRLGARMRSWNQAHSSNRVAVEHVIGRMKQWACIRGTSKYRQFKEHDTFVKIVQVVHSLTNADTCGFDVMRLFTSRVQN